MSTTSSGTCLARLSCQQVATHVRTPFGASFAVSFDIQAHPFYTGSTRVLGENRGETMVLIAIKLAHPETVLTEASQLYVVCDRDDADRYLAYMRLLPRFLQQPADTSIVRLQNAPALGAVNAGTEAIEWEREVAWVAYPATQSVFDFDKRSLIRPQNMRGDLISVKWSVAIYDTHLVGTPVWDVRDAHRAEQFPSAASVHGLHRLNFGPEIVRAAS